MANKRKNRSQLVRKLRRIWSIPIVRIFAGVLGFCIIITLISTVFNGCSDHSEQSDVSTTADSGVPEMSAPPVMSEVSVPQVSESPDVTPFGRWDFSDVKDVSEEISSKYGIVIDATNRKVLGGKNYSQRIYPASMTKIMTLVVAAESNLDLNAEFKITYQLVNKYYPDATTTGIKAGDTVTVKDLLYGAILLSAADATEAIAITVAGSEENFVELMNQTAKKLGCSNTHFTNTSGLHSTENYSTLGDMALILDYAMDIPLCKEVLSTETYNTPPTELSSEGYMFFSTMYSRVDKDYIKGMTLVGGKTGYINESRHCLASMAIGDNGNEYIVVTVEGMDRYAPINDCKALYSMFYNNTDN